MGFFQVEKIADPVAIPTKVLKAGSKRNYHTLDWTGQSVDRHSVENQLSKIEGRHDQMLKAIIADPTDLDAWRSDLIEFVNLMHHRVPAFKRDIEHALRENLNAAGRMLLRGGNLPEPPAKIKQLMAETGDDIFHARISNWKLVQMMFN